MPELEILEARSRSARRGWSSEPETAASRLAPVTAWLAARSSAGPATFSRPTSPSFSTGRKTRPG